MITPLYTDESEHKPSVAFSQERACGAQWTQRFGYGQTRGRWRSGPSMESGLGAFLDCSSTSQEPGWFLFPGKPGIRGRLVSGPVARGWSRSAPGPVTVLATFQRQKRDRSWSDQGNRGSLSVLARKEKTLGDGIRPASASTRLHPLIGVDLAGFQASLSQLEVYESGLMDTDE